MWTSNAQRLVAWHIKDATRLVPQPLPPVNPFTQVVTRPPRFAPGGDLGNNDALFDDVAVKGAKFYIVESDNAIGPVPADPGRSLRHAKLGIEYLLGLRTGPNGRGHSDVSEDTPSESAAEEAAG